MLTPPRRILFFPVVVFFLCVFVAPRGTTAESGTKARVTKETVEQLMVKAEKGDAEAQFLLGHCHYTGKGVPQDATQAVIWYRKAAEQGHASAQYFLGECYFWGKGVERDYSQTLIWYRKAAEQGFPLAQMKLGSCYDDGIGVPKNTVQAVSWYRKAAEQGDASAQFILGLCYVKGNGVPQDNLLAYMWLNLAKTDDEQLVKINRNICGEIEKMLTSDQLAEAKKLSKEWKPKKTDNDQTPQKP